LFFARCLLLLLRAAILLVLVVIVVAVEIALLVCPAPFPGWALFVSAPGNILEMLASCKVVWWSATRKLGLACHNALSTSLAYFNLLAIGHSADLGEEAGLGMTEENEGKVA
jgi:hypothetical protein